MKISSEQLSLIFCVNLFTFAHLNAAKKIEADEGETVDLKCAATDEGIRVTAATWQYTRTNIENMFTPNWRNFAFLWGVYLGMCRYDVAGRVAEKCNGNNSCQFEATKNFFQTTCGYNMFVNIDYECVRFCEGALKTKQKRSPPSPASTPSTSRPRVCVPSHGLSFQQIVRALEGRYGSRVPTDMGQAVTGITTRNVRSLSGEQATLVYVMHARISNETTQGREQMPRGVEARMRQLHAHSHDDRGHLLASTLGGPSHVLNIVPQYCELNRNAYKNGETWWRRLEREIRQNVDSSEVDYVDWTVIVRYNEPEITGDFRPIAFALRIVIHYTNGTTNEDVTNGQFSGNEIYLPNDDEVCGAVEMFPEDWFAGRY